MSGAGKAFVQAASEMLGREISTAELTDLMKAKKLPTEKLLPIVAKYWKAMSDDALNKKLQQLAAVESRMVESWTRFLGMLYDSGVESSLSNLYKGLDRILYSIKNLAGNALGKFLKGALDMLSESALFVLDAFQLIFYYVDKAFGTDSNLKGFTAELLGQGAAAIALFFTLRKILEIMGLLRLAAKLFKTELVAAAGAEAAGSIAGNLEKQKGKFSSLGSLLGKAMGVTLAWELGTAVGEYLRNNFSGVKSFGDWLGTFTAQRLNPSAADAATGRSAFAAMNGAGFNAAWANSQPMFMQNQQPTAKVELTLNGELSKIVDTKITENNTRTIQAILPTGSVQGSQ